MSQRFFQPSAALMLALTMVFLTLDVGLAQTQSGNVFGHVRDGDGSPIPGVTVTLSGIGAPQTFVTTRDGSYRFLGLSPGRYFLKSELQGFSSLSRPVDVNVGTSSTIDVNLTPALEESITISAETPLLDPRNTGTGAMISEFELEAVPTARDPWVILQSVPGVLVDRVNVGGDQSGQQSYFVGKGVERHQTAWNLDGVNVTEMQATGTSSFYYDFDSFEEMRITTGGSDPAVRTPGVQINMVTKRGTNEFNGSARYFLTDEAFQTDPEIPKEARGYLTAVNSIDTIDDYGLEMGGPILRDRLWLWGAYSQNTINNFSAGERFLKETELENWNGKLNAQLLQNNSANLYYMFSDKVVLGRNVSPTRPPETGVNQSGPSNVLKFEDTHIFSPNFYLTGMISDMDAGYELTPAGGRDIEVYWDNDGSIPHRSYRHFEQSTPQSSYRADGSFFGDTGPLNHELKFGFGYRDTPVESLTSWPGNGTWGEFYDDPADNRAAITRDAVPKFGAKYTDFYLGDTLLLNNLTVRGGVRYDLQKASNDPSQVPANPLFPEILGDVSFAGDDQALEWETISPKIGATYGLGTGRRTMLRGSYNRYVDQLGSSDVGPNNPFYRVQKLYYAWQDANGDKTVQRGEVDIAGGIIDFTDVDPNNPDGGYSTGRIDYDMDPTTTDEVVFGVEHELIPAFAVGLDYTYRLRDNFVWTVFEKTKGSGNLYSTADYVIQPNRVNGTLPDGTPYSLENYRLRPGLPAPTYTVTTNRPDYTQTYQGLELTATKRMSNNWMMRANVTLSEWEQQVGEKAIVDPTRLLVNALDGCNICDGAPVASAGGNGGYINSRWAYSANGVYQLPFQISLGAAVTGREGYVIPYYFRVNNSDRVGNKQVLLTQFGDTRLPDVFNLDLRLAKDFSLPSDLVMNLSVDLFNATNETPVLDRANRLFVANGADARNNRIEALQSPRIFRVGARFRF